MNIGFRKTIIIICTVVQLISLAGLGYYFYRQYLEGQVDKQVSGLVTETPSSAPTPTLEATAEPKAEPTAAPAPEVLEKYADLVEQNPDTIGWLKIEGTPIDYVVMQTPDVPDKYLHIDFYGNYSNRGTLYMDEACNIWNSENLIIYGHHMKSSAMFGDLDYFSSKNYWEDHKYIQFDTIYQEQTYEIVAAFYSRILYKDEEGFRYYRFIEADNEGEWSEYADFIKENQCYDTGVDIKYGDRLLTLSTCAYQVENGRFAVVAKLIDPAPSPPAADSGSADEAPAASPLAQSAALGIEEGDTPLASYPEERSQSFSTDMILLALCLVVSGTAVLAFYRSRHKR